MKTPDPNAQSATAPASGTQSEKTPDAQPSAVTGRPRTQQKPLEDTALLSATRARRTEEQQDEPERTNAAQTSIAQSLDHAAALISDLASVATPTQVSEPAKTPDERPAVKSALNATAAVEAPDSVLPAVNPVLGNLAFALRLNTSSNNDAPSQLGLQNTPFSQNLNSSLSAAGATPVPSAPQQKLESQIQNFVAQQPLADHTSAQPPANVHGPEAPAPTHASDFETELEKFRAAEPVRGAHVQISGTDSQRVDIRLVERAGALSLTVRSADNTLARTLQDHASELNTRLNLEHYRTELWTPAASNTSSARDSSTGDQQNHAASYSSDSNPNQKQQQNSRQQSQPDWIDELENNSKAFQKRIEYTWS